MPRRMKLVHWPLMDGLLHLVQRGGDGAGSSRTAVHVYNGPFLCGFNAPMKGLKMLSFNAPIKGLTMLLTSETAAELNDIETSRGDE